MEDDYEGGTKPLLDDDLVSTTGYGPRGALALTLADRKEFPERATMVAFGRRACGLDSARAR